MGSGAASGTAADYKAAIGRYQDFLKTYPNDPGNDRVLYQLARAHELSGDLETSLKTLDRLVQAYPATRYREEAQFRRGELMFTLRDYPNAEKAYAITMQGDRASPFHERSLYMHGWSLFKQGRLEDSLQSFFRRARPEAGRSRQRRAIWRRCRGSRAPTANWSRTPSA